MRRSFVIVLLAASLVGPRAPAADFPIRVGVSIPPQKYLVERIGGGRIDVVVMLTPGHAPETFEPTPRQVAALSGTGIYFRIGVPFESAWLAPLQAGNPSMRIVDCCAQFLLPGHDEHHEGGDPHVWVSPPAAMQIAQDMERELARLDPAGAAEYAANLGLLLSDLRGLHAEIEAILSTRSTDHFVIAHDSLGQFAAAYGLVQHSLESGGKAAGPRAIAEIVSVARAERIRSVLAQREFSLTAAAALAREIDGEVMMIDPLAMDFMHGMRDLALKVAAAVNPQ